MPRLAGFLKRSWAIGTDDFALLCPPSAAVHVVWGVLTTFISVRTFGYRIPTPAGLWDLNLSLCAANTLLDLVITYFACRGAVLDIERRAAVPPLLRLRCFLGLVLFIVAGWTAFLALWAVKISKPVPEFLDLEKQHPVVAWLSLFAAILILTTELAGFTFACLMGILISRPSACSTGRQVGAASFSAVNTLLRWFGASDKVVGNMTEVLLQLLSDVDLVPSDIIFGLLLVAVRQMREDRENMTLDPGSGVEEAVLRDFARLSMYASGIYGTALGAIGEAAYEGTSIVAPHRLAASCCRALPCMQHPKFGGPAADGPWCISPPEVPAEGDFCCFSQSYALLRSVAQRGGDSELVWATWLAGGYGHAPPFAVFLDHGAKEVVITIRGTFSVKDCIMDAACMPENFDPLQLANGAQAGAEVDDSEVNLGCFVHTGILACMRDLLKRLDAQGILEELLKPTGKGFGYSVVCTGHSLGAGIAVLLALELRARLGERVRYAGFAPPGGMLSPKLAEETVRLGWYSLTLSQDWVPRLGLRSLQVLREQVLDEIAGCPHSKLRVMLMFSYHTLRPRFARCRCLSTLLCGPSGLPRAQTYQQRDVELGETQASPLSPVAGSAPSKGASFGRSFGKSGPGAAVLGMEEWRARRNDSTFFVAAMMCPGRVVMLRPVGTESLLCGLYSRQARWSAETSSSANLQEILVTPRAVEHHFPHIIESALLSALCSSARTELGSPQAGAEEAWEA